MTPNPLVTSLNTNTTLIAERMPGRGEPMLQGGVTVINSMTIGRGNNLDRPTDCRVLHLVRVAHCIRVHHAPAL